MGWWSPNDIAPMQRRGEVRESWTLQAAGAGHAKLPAKAAARFGDRVPLAQGE